MSSKGLCRARFNIITLSSDVAVRVRCCPLGWEPAAALTVNEKVERLLVILSANG